MKTEEHVSRTDKLKHYLLPVHAFYHFKITKFIQKENNSDQSTIPSR